MEKKYRAYYDDGHDTGEFEFWSKYKANSKKNRMDAEKEALKKFGLPRFRQIIIVSTQLVF